MRYQLRRAWQVAGGQLAPLLLVAMCATSARATPITFQFSGTGSGTVAGIPFTDAAYVIRAAGDTATVSVIGGFPFPGSVATAPVAVTMEIAAVGTAALTGDGSVIVESPNATIRLRVGSPTALLQSAHLALLGYDLRSPFGPLVMAGPPFLSHVGQPSDLGVITLDSSSTVTFAAITTCGNGVVEAEEECDDGNASGADCCAPGCQIANAGTTCRPGAAPCDATEVCSGTSATCPFDGPASGCLAAEKSRIVLAPGEVAGEGRVSWRWAKGAALAAADLGDPTVNASYELCVFSGSAAALTASAELAAGAQWSPLGVNGYRFKEPVPPTVLRLRGGAAGKSTAAMKKRGIDLEQSFPVAAPVIVQLRKVGSPLCLESRFETLQRSDATGLQAQRP